MNMKELFMMILGVDSESLDLVTLENRYIELSLLTSPSNGGDIKLYTLIKVAYEKLLEIINEEICEKNDLKINKKYKLSFNQLLDLDCNSFNHGFNIDGTFLDISNLPYNSVRVKSKAIITIKKFLPLFSKYYNNDKTKNFKINNRLDYDINIPIKLNEYGIYSINIDIEGNKNKFIILLSPFKPEFKINTFILSKINKYLNINIYLKISKR